MFRSLSTLDSALIPRSSLVEGIGQRLQQDLVKLTHLCPVSINDGGSALGAFSFIRPASACACISRGYPEAEAMPYYCHGKS